MLSGAEGRFWIAGDGRARVTEMWVEDHAGERKSVLMQGERCTFKAWVRFNEAVDDPSFAVSWVNEFHQNHFVAATALECSVDELAYRLGVDPLELRRRWAYVEGDVTPTGQVLHESVAALVQAVAPLERFTVDLAVHLERSLAFYAALGYQVIGSVRATSLGDLTMLKLPDDPFVAIELVSGSSASASSGSPPAAASWSPGACSGQSLNAPAWSWSRKLGAPRREPFRAGRHLPDALRHRSERGGRRVPLSACPADSVHRQCDIDPR